MRHSILLLLPLALACAPEGAADETGDDVDPYADAVDLRFDIPAEDGDTLVFTSKELVVDAYEDTQHCVLHTYDGPDVGVSQVTTYQAAHYGHHVLFYGVNLDPAEYPDGHSFECSDPSTMELVSPLFFTEPWEEDDETVRTRVVLPEGMGMTLKSGQRFLLQNHYVNYSDEPFVVQDAAVLETMPEDQVETWAAPWGHGTIDMPLPAQTETVLPLDCTWPTDVTVMTVMGHMHEYGLSFSVDHTPVDGATTNRIYDIPEWDLDYRDAPPILSFGDEGMAVKKGDTFRTTCSFFNSEDHELNFPEEMCASFGIAYPSKVPLLCEAAKAD